MKKKLNEDAISNELRGGSAFFRPAEQAAPPLPSPEPTGAEVEPSEETRPSVRPDGRPYARTGNRREIRRYPFEFYVDQLTALKQLSLDEQRDGGPGSMSRMVREAIDQWLSQRSAVKEGTGN